MMLDKLRNLFRCAFRVFRGYMNSIYEQYLESERKKRKGGRKEATNANVTLCSKHSITL